MATYYLSTSTGNDSWTGLSATFTSGSTGPWKTLAKALGAAGMASGDILYVAPGNYNESVTIGFAPSVATQIIGDPNSLLFAGITAGPILFSAFNAAGTSETVTSTLIIAASRSYFEWSNIYFKVSTGKAVTATNARYWKFTNCVLDCNTRSTPTGIITLSSATGVALDATITRCRFAGGRYLLHLTGQNVSDTTSVTSSVFESSEEGIDINNLQVSVTNCSFISCDWAIYQRSGSVSFPSSVRNCLFLRCTQVQVTTTGQLTENFNRWTTATRNNIGTLGANSTTGGDGGIDSGYLLQTNGNYLQTYTPNLSSPNIAFGTSTSSPATDLYGVTWSGASPDAGGITYRVITSLPSLVAYNGGIERNASAITIAPASTSQSIELYLGATGLAFNTSGLAAYYVRNQAAPVAITLVTQTPTGAWTSGGFAEISSSLVPGVYRLDVPNAAFIAGASDVTIVVRGASGTNGAVLTVTLSSGGLTAAQTAAAVWDEPYTSHVTASTFGARTLKTTVDNRPVDVGSSQHIHANVHAIVDSTAAASELSGALLHNGTDYIDSNLLGGASTRVFVGRFDLRQTGSETVDTIEVFTTDTPSFELQLTDGDGNSVPVTGATLGLRILDVASTVVETGTPTVEYGTGGIVRWTGPGTYLAIGCPVGNYRLFIDRTVSGTTTTFGPLQIRVQAQ